MFFKKSFEKILGFPQKGRVEIEFDPRRKVVSFSTPVFTCKKLPQRIQDYVKARKDLKFRPYATSLRIDGDQVVLMQQIPFTPDFQSISRREVDEFCTLSRGCYNIFFDMWKET